MDLQLTEEHKMIQEAARSFAQNEIAPIATELDERGDFPYETIKKMGQLGFMGIEVPESYGGAGMDAIAYVLAMEEINKVDASHGIIMSVNNSLFCHGILAHGTEEQKQEFVVPIASGGKIGAYSLTEPMSGSDAATMRSRAVRDGDADRGRRPVDPEQGRLRRLPQRVLGADRHPGPARRLRPADEPISGAV